MRRLGFRGWLRRQRRRQDAVGDIARDLAADRCAAWLRSLSALQAHLLLHNAEDRFVAALGAAYREWQATRRDNR